MNRRSKQIILIVLILLISISSIYYLRTTGQLADEQTHYTQILTFMRGESNLIIAEIPGYHLFMMGVANLFGVSSLIAFRILATCFSIISVLLFFLIANELSPKNSIIKTLQYYFLPILFPFFFLVYIDVFSLMLILLSFFLILKNKYFFSGFFGVLSVLVRQDNIVWLIFLFVYAYHKNFDIKFNWQIIVQSFRKFFIFWFGIIGFFIFFLINKSLVFGNNQIFQTLHPSLSFHIENFFFMLFIFFFLFLPLNINNFSKIKVLLKKNNTLIISVILLFILYFFFFVVNHPYNLNQLDYFLRHKLLSFFYSSLIIKAVLFIPIAYSFLSIIVTKFERKSFNLLYLFTLFYLVFHWLIEQRYYIIPFAFFLLFRKSDSKIVEYSIIGLFALISLIFFFGIRNMLFFL